MKINKIVVIVLITMSLKATNWFKSAEIKTDEIAGKVSTDIKPAREKAKQDLKKAKSWLEEAKNKTEEFASNLKNKIMPAKKSKVEEKTGSKNLEKNEEKTAPKKIETVENNGTENKSKAKTVSTIPAVAKVEPKVEPKNESQITPVKEIKTESQNKTGEQSKSA